MKLKRFLRIAYGLALLLPLPELSSANSAIGNGGDIFSHYLESSRFALKETLRKIAIDPPRNRNLCRSVRNLTKPQLIECREFILKTLPEMLSMQNVSPIPQFLLRATPLTVIGPDGALFEVDAKTPLGRDGDIEIAFPRVRYYSPRQLLQLITHEFGHKVIFKKRYIEDNLPTDTFASGRKLLDAVGIAIADYAQNTGAVGRYFRLLDRFACRVRPTHGGAGLGTSGFTRRLFTLRNSFDRYESGIGLGPDSLAVYAIETNLDEIHFQIQIHEETACVAESPYNRWTDYRLVRKFATPPGVPAPPDEVLIQERRESWNPLCASNQTPPELIALTYQDLVFECAYYGSSGSSTESLLQNPDMNSTR